MNSSSGLSMRFRSTLEKRHWVVAAAAAVSSIAVIVLRFQLWQFDLRAPLAYRQDALYFQVMTKALGEHAWNDHIARLGAPFGLDAVDFPLRCSLDYGLIKLLMLIFHSPFLVVNLYWLLAAGLAGASATLFMRFLRANAPASFTFGVLFGILPFTFFRSVAHLNLLTFMIPAGAFLAVSVARGEITWKSKQQLWLPLLLSVAVGFIYIYWAFFTCILIALGGLIGFFLHRQRRTLLVAVCLVALISTAAFLNLAPTLSYWHEHGRNPAVVFKSPSEADVYGLRIRQMLTPVFSNGFPWMQRIRERIVAGGFPEDAKDANESVSASLGTLGAIGFLMLLAIVLWPRLANPPEDITILASLTLAVVLICHTGGLGGLFNVFVTNEFRCYNRISPFISLFSFALLATTFDRIFGRHRGLTSLAASCAIITFAAFDQIPLYYLSFHRDIEREFRQDEATFRAIDGLLPAGASVFQLPYMPFPVDSGVNTLPYYENSKAYLQSSKIRWSWGAMTGRHDNWTQVTSSLPVEAMLRRIGDAGFQGVLISRGGYTDRTVEDAVSALAGAPSFVSSDSRWVFYDLRAYVDNMKSHPSSEGGEIR